MRKIPWQEIVMTCIGIFLGIGGLAFLAHLTGEHWIIAPFGSSAVLIYYATSSPLAKPKNLICSHLLAAFIAITCVKLMENTWYCMMLAVTFATLIMALTDTVHPPAGATALFCAIEGINHYSFILMPVATGVLVLFLTAVLSAKIFPGLRPYPYPEKKE